MDMLIRNLYVCIVLMLLFGTAYSQINSPSNRKPANTNMRVTNANVGKSTEKSVKPMISPSTNDDADGVWYGSCCGGVLLLMGLVWGLNAYNNGAEEREMKKAAKKRAAEERRRQAWLASPEGIAWTAAQQKLADEQAEREAEAQRIRDEEKRKHEEWLQTTPEGRAEAKRLARMREAMEDTTITDEPSISYEAPSFGSTSAPASAPETGEF